MDVTFASRPAPRSSTPNEDFVAVTSQTVVVLDGLSVPKTMETGCTHGTAWFVQQLGTRILARATQVPLTPLPEVLADSISEVTALHSASCDLAHPGTPAATVAVLRTAGPVEYLVLSDSTIVLDTVSNGIEVINDSRVEGTASAKEQSLLATPADSPFRADLRKEMVAERRSVRNTVDGYWVASSSPEAADRALTGSFRPGKVQQAAVLTDGAARLVSFGLTDWKGMLEALESHGPDHLIMQVREAEGSDPGCVNWPRSKPYDDATVAYCRINNIRTRW